MNRKWDTNSIVVDDRRTATRSNLQRSLKDCNVKDYISENENNQKQSTCHLSRFSSKATTVINTFCISSTINFRQDEWCCCSERSDCKKWKNHIHLQVAISSTSAIEAKSLCFFSEACDRTYKNEWLFTARADLSQRYLSSWYEISRDSDRFACEIERCIEEKISKASRRRVYFTKLLKYWFWWWKCREYRFLIAFIFISFHRNERVQRWRKTRSDWSIWSSLRDT